MLKDNFNLAYKNIRERMSRSILTLLGISIGVMAIISLMALGEGMNQAVMGELLPLSDTILVQVGEGFSIFSMGGGSLDNGGEEEYLTERDITDVKRIWGIKEVNTQLSGSGIMSYNGEDIGVSLTGMVVDAMEVQYGLEDFESGHLLQNGDQNKIIIGYDVAHEYFDADISVGSRIKVNGEKLPVLNFSMGGTDTLARQIGQFYQRMFKAVGLNIEVEYQQYYLYLKHNHISFYVKLPPLALSCQMELRHS